MSDRLPWFPFYVDDFLLDERVRAMSLAEVGAYVKLLCWQWREGSIPAEIHLLKPGLSPASGELPEANLVAILRACFGFDGIDAADAPFRLTNNRLSEIAKEQRVRSASLARAGRKGGLSQARARLKQSETEKEKEVTVPTPTKRASAPKADRPLTADQLRLKPYWDAYKAELGDPSAGLLRKTMFAIEDEVGPEKALRILRFWMASTDSRYGGLGAMAGKWRQYDIPDLVDEFGGLDEAKVTEALRRLG
jgi:uncharacterized protein YdaU (DUF1376 family)